MSVRWRYATPEEVVEITNPSSGDEAPPERLDLLSVVSGTVLDQEGRTIEIPEGMVLKLLDSVCDAGWCYLTQEVTVLVQGKESTIRAGVPVALFSQAHLKL